MGAHTGTDLVEAGWAALAQGAWTEARAAFQEAVATAPTAEAYEGLGWSAVWMTDVDLLFDARLEAYRRYRAAGDRVGAARVALWIGSDYFDYRAEPGAANGWFRRARRLLDGLDPTAEHGWLAVQEAALLLADRSDTAQVRQLGATAAHIGRQLDQGDVEMIGLATEGLALVTEGRVDEGMALLDEATAIALAEEWTWSYALPWTCCYLIYACETLYDYERAAEWCRQAGEIADRQGLGFVWGMCRARHAGVLVMQGDWSAAEAELAEATEVLERSRPHWVGEATVRLGELRRRQGRLDEARELFRLVESEPEALVGLGQIALDDGDATKARDLAERASRTMESSYRTERAASTHLLALAHVAAGDLDRAAESLAELEALSVVTHAAPLAALASYGRGAYAQAAGDLDVARRRFEDAITAAERARLPYEAAQARLELAGVLSGLGRPGEAHDLAARAENELRQLGADVLSMRARDLAAQTADAKRATPAGPRSTVRALLTPRQVEVLDLVAQGLSDREIAAELVVSEHTVHRHVANILTKLDCSTRAAAVARAAAAGVLEQPTG